MGAMLPETVPEPACRIDIPLQTNLVAPWEAMEKDWKVTKLLAHYPLSAFFERDICLKTFVRDMFFRGVFLDICFRDIVLDMS